MNIVNFIFREFEKKSAPVPAEVISSHLNLPADFTDKVLNHLTKEGIILKTTEPAVGFTPSTVAENVTLADIADAVNTSSFARPANQSAILTQISAERREKLSKFTVRDAIRNL